MAPLEIKALTVVGWFVLRLRDRDRDADGEEGRWRE